MKERIRVLIELDVKAAKANAIRNNPDQAKHIEAMRPQTILAGLHKARVLIKDPAITQEMKAESQEWLDSWKLRLVH